MSSAVTAELEEWRNARMAPTGESGGRSDGQRDADRVLYSTAFRRLGGVTQVIAVHEPTLLHNRLTHSMKVAQIAHRLAQKLRRDTADHERIARGYGLDPDVVYAAALAHDLGHPPFGHVAEEELQLILRGMDQFEDLPSQQPAESPRGLNDTFEGNAQSFRIVTKLSWQKEQEPGLNLTRATLNAIMKYPWTCGNHPASSAQYLHKWSAYDSEAGDNGPFRFARNGIDDPLRRTLEAEIMDWADDIAYAVHDVEDFFRAGIVPLDRVVTEQAQSEWFLAKAIKRVKGDPEAAYGAFTRLRRDYLVRTPYRGTRDDQIALAGMSSFLIGRYIDAASVTTDGHLDIQKSRRLEVDLLKQLTRIYTIENPSLGSLQQGQRRMVRELFDSLNSWVEKIDRANGGREQLPVQLWDLLSDVRTDPEADVYSDDGKRSRAIVDYLSGLTEAQTIDLHERMLGRSSGSGLTTWLSMG